MAGGLEPLPSSKCQDAPHWAFPHGPEWHHDEAKPHVRVLTKVGYGFDEDREPTYDSLDMAPPPRASPSPLRRPPVSDPAVDGHDLTSPPRPVQLFPPAPAIPAVPMYVAFQDEGEDGPDSADFIPDTSGHRALPYWTHSDPVAGEGSRPGSSEGDDADEAIPTFDVVAPEVADYPPDLPPALTAQCIVMLTAHAQQHRNLNLTAAQLAQRTVGFLGSVSPETLDVAMAVLAVWRRKNEPPDHPRLSPSPPPLQASLVAELDTELQPSPLVSPSTQPLLTPNTEAPGPPPLLFTDAPHSDRRGADVGHRPVAQWRSSDADDSTQAHHWWGTANGSLPTHTGGQEAATNQVPPPTATPAPTAAASSPSPAATPPPDAAGPKSAFTAPPAPARPAALAPLPDGAVAGSPPNSPQKGSPHGRVPLRVANLKATLAASPDPEVAVSTAHPKLPGSPPKTDDHAPHFTPHPRVAAAYGSAPLASSAAESTGRGAAAPRHISLEGRAEAGITVWAAKPKPKPSSSPPLQPVADASPSSAGSAAGASPLRPPGLGSSGGPSDPLAASSGGGPRNDGQGAAETTHLQGLAPPSPVSTTVLLELPPTPATGPPSALQAVPLREAPPDVAAGSAPLVRPSLIPLPSPALPPSQPAPNHTPGSRIPPQPTPPAVLVAAPRRDQDGRKPSPTKNSATNGRKDLPLPARPTGLPPVGHPFVSPATVPPQPPQALVARPRPPAAAEGYPAFHAVLRPDPAPPPDGRPAAETPPRTRLRLSPRIGRRGESGDSAESQNEEGDVERLRRVSSDPRGPAPPPPPPPAGQWVTSAAVPPVPPPEHIMAGASPSRRLSAPSHMQSQPGNNREPAFLKPITDSPNTTLGYVWSDTTHSWEMASPDPPSDTRHLWTSREPDRKPSPSLLGLPSPASTFSSGLLYPEPRPANGPPAPVARNLNGFSASSSAIQNSSTSTTVVDTILEESRQYTSQSPAVSTANIVWKSPLEQSPPVTTRCYRLSPARTPPAGSGPYLSAAPARPPLAIPGGLGSLLFSGSQPVVNGAPPSTFTSPNISSILNATDPGAMPSLADQPPVSPRRDPIPRYTTTTLPATYRSTVREFVSSNTAVFRTSSPGINDAANRPPPFGGPTVRSQSPRWRAAPAAPPVTAAVGVAAPTTAVPGQRPTFESPKVRHYSPGMASTDGFPRTRLTSLDPPDRPAPPRPGPTAAPTVLLATPRASPARSDAPASPGRPGAPGPPAAPASRSPRRPSLQELEEEIKARAAALPPYCVTSGMAQQPSAYFSSLPAPSSARPATMTSSLPTQREGGFQSPYRMSPNVTRVSVLQPSSSPVRTYRYSSADAGPVRSSPYDAPLAAHPPGPAPPTYASSPVRTVRMASYSSPLRAGYSSTTSILTPSLSPLSGIATPSHQSSPLRLPRGYAYPMSTS